MSETNCAIKMDFKILITRNEKDFKESDIPVMTPDEYLKSLKEIQSKANQLLTLSISHSAILEITVPLPTLVRNMASNIRFRIAIYCFSSKYD